MAEPTVVHITTGSLFNTEQTGEHFNRSCGC